MTPPPLSDAELGLERLQPPPLPPLHAQQGRLHIELGSRSYPIHIGPWPPASASRGLALIVSNTQVAALYAQALREHLQPAHCRVVQVELPDGEAHKTWASVALILDALLAAGADRRAVVYALGGGVVGDLAGFAAAIFMRGIDVVQVPTTLLAQVDSSVGGKTGFNHARGKNLIGAFHQPRAVWVDLRTLASLPPREYASGLAEIVKAALIGDPVFFAWLEQHAVALAQRDEGTLARAVRRSCEIKAAVVAADEQETGLRAALNLGHTFGHALEAGLGYGKWLHGEAVAVGLRMALQASEAVLACPPALGVRLAALLHELGLPLQAPWLDPAQFMSLMQGDKKNVEGTIRFVLLQDLARPVLARLPRDVALAAIAAHSAPAA